jgi:hypothetical protein
MKRHPPRRRIQVLLPADLADRLVKTCAASDRPVTLTMFIADAIRDRLDGTVDKAQLFRRLDQNTAAQEQTERGVQLLQDALGHFLRFWFAHTPPVPDEHKRRARDQGEVRYKQFVEHLAGRLSEGRHFADDLPRPLVPRGTKRQSSHPESPSSESTPPTKPATADPTGPAGR